MQNRLHRILRIDSSSRITGSYSRQLTQRIIDELVQQYEPVSVVERDILNLPFLSETAVKAMFIPEEKRTTEEKESLTISDVLTEELKAADILVLGVPMYNFMIPAALKAYIDLVVRVNATFVHTDEGSKGLLHGKKAFVVITSEGTVFKSNVDFTSPYMQFILSFIGIKDVVLIDATQIGEKGEDKVLSYAEKQILLSVENNRARAVA